MSMPEGFYTGTIESPRWLRVANHGWTGKRFTDSYVENKIFGRFMVRGEVTGTPEHIFIRYRSGLVDELRLVEDVYHGTMKLGLFVVTFTLRQS